MTHNPAHATQVLDPRRRVVLLDTGTMGAEARAGEAVTNPSEAGVLCAVVGALLGGRVAAGSIGIISPYKAQVLCTGLQCGAAFALCMQQQLCLLVAWQGN